MMAVWWWLPLPPWLGSGALWFLVLNVVVAAVAVLSSRARPPLAASPRRGAGVTRRASSAVLQRLRSSFSIFSFPSACFTTAPFTQPDATTQETEEATASAQETEEAPAMPSPRALPVPLSPSSAPERVPAAGEDVDEDEDDEASGMSMDEAYALALAARRRPEGEREEETRRSEVDAKAEEFIRGFQDDERQQRLNSIFNYTQMLKQRAHGAGRRQPDARPEQL